MKYFTFFLAWVCVGMAVVHDDDEESHHYIVRVRPAHPPVPRSSLTAWTGADAHAHSTPHSFLLFASPHRIIIGIPTDVLVDFTRASRQQSGGACPAEALTVVHSAPRRKSHVAVTTSCEHTVAGLLSDPTVRWIERVRRFAPLNAIATWTLQSPTVPLSHPLWARNLTGDGHLLAVGDTGLDFFSCFFYDPSEPVTFFPHVNPRHRKVFTYVECVDENGGRDHTDAEAAHGTHVAGSAAGHAVDQTTPEAAFGGMAPGARLFFQDLACGDGLKFHLPLDMSDYFALGYDAGVRVSSSSWGSDESPSEYTTIDRETDAFAYAHPDYLAIFAAGNEESSGIRSPATSKNVLTVGAHYNSVDPAVRDDMTGYSSFGPTYDHRTKPDVVGPGQTVASARSSGPGGTTDHQCRLESMGGSSMATPLVAGSAILARQYLIRDVHIPSPTAALLKAFLVHGARPMHGRNQNGDALDCRVPSPFQGWGRLEVTHHVLFNHTATQMVDRTRGISHNAQASIRVRTSDVLEFRATLVWTDPPSAAEGSVVSLVNRLHVVVINDATGIIMARTNESQSNVEQITIPRDSGDTRFVRVIIFGAHISDGESQAYAVVVSGEIVGAAAEGGAPCPSQCSGHGMCDSNTGECRCNEGWRHVDCAECDGVAKCNGRGTCDGSGKCSCAVTAHGLACERCVEGWVGPLCDIPYAPCTQQGVPDNATGRCVCRGPDISGRLCEYCRRDRRGWPQCATPSSWCVNRNARVIHTTDTAPIGGWLQVGAEGEHYANSLNCTWVLTSHNATHRFVLTFAFLNLEAPYDVVTITDNIRGTTSRNFTGRPTLLPIVTSATSSVTISFTSDLFGNDLGFAIFYEIEVEGDVRPSAGHNASWASASDIVFAGAGTVLLFGALGMLRMLRQIPIK